VERKAIIFHGTGRDPEGCWHRWLGRRLAERGYAGLGGTQLVRDDGHFGDHDQPYQPSRSRGCGQGILPPCPDQSGRAWRWAGAVP
jgi:hypothetical protein